jgi:hypothetical protein
VAHRLIRRGRPVPQGTAPALVLSSPTAPTDHRANVVHRLGRRGCPVPQGTKQRTSSPTPALSSSPTAPAGHQADVAHHLIRRGRPVPQGTTPAPVLSSPTAPTGHWADVALRLIRRGRPVVPQGTAPARPVLSSSTAPAGHRANAAHHLGHRGRHVPQGTKQHTSSCAVVPDGAHRPSGQFELPLPNGTPRIALLRTIDRSPLARSRALYV